MERSRNNNVGEKNENLRQMNNAIQDALFISKSSTNCERGIQKKPLGGHSFIFEKCLILIMVAGDPESIPESNTRREAGIHLERDP